MADIAASVHINGGTRFSYHLTYRLPPPGIGPLFDRWFLAPAWERAIAAALANLKRMVETGSGT